MSNGIPDDPPADSLWFLVVEARSRPNAVFTDRWELGLGTKKELLGMESMCAASPEEEQTLLHALGRELQRHQGRVNVIVTPTNWELAFARTRLLTIPADDLPTLTGYRHLPVHDVLNQYFLTAPPGVLRTVEGHRPTTAAVQTDGGGPALEIQSVKHLWNVRRKIEHLVPKRALKGEFI